MSSTTAVRVHPRRGRHVAVACGAVALLLGASGCGNGSNAGATGRTGENGAPQGQQQAQQRGGPAGQFPGANGKVAAVTGSTAQVQSVQDGQVAVTWTGSTTFTRQVAATLSDVKAGVCVAVSAVTPSSSASTTAPATEVTAGTIRITGKVNGACWFGGPRFDGGPQGNGRPPSGAPSGDSRPQVRGVGGAFGEVTAVAANGLTVSSQVPGNATRTTVTVTVDAGTTYTATARGAASDVKVGVCVRADGSTDSTGAVTARTIAVSPPENGQCGGFVRFRPGDGPGLGASNGAGNGAGNDQQGS